MNDVFKFEIEVPKTLMERRGLLLKTMLETFLTKGIIRFRPSTIFAYWKQRDKEITRGEIQGDFNVLEGLGYLKRMKVGFGDYELTKKAYSLLKTKEILEL